MRWASKTGDVARYVPTLQHAGIDLIQQLPADGDAAPDVFEDPPMPRFDANLSFLFNEVPFLDRFGEAARTGFGAVEFAFGYDHPVAEIAARLAGNGLQQVLINAPPGDWAQGERGLASLPGREAEFAASVGTALRYARGWRVPGYTSWPACCHRRPMLHGVTGIALRSCATCGWLRARPRDRASP